MAGLPEVMLDYQKGILVVRVGEGTAVHRLLLGRGLVWVELDKAKGAVAIVVERYR